VNFWLTAGELVYILKNSESTVLVTSRAKLDTVLAALADTPDITCGLTT
jgi:long-subunit acyl-CoA synthetase (AMP-forming)